MESDNNIIKNLKDYITRLKQLNEPFQSSKEDFQNEDQESTLLQKVVDSFDIILSNNFILKDSNNIPKGKNNYYYDFITKHFNTPLIRFFLLNYELLPINNNSNNHSSEKNWILLSILENSFSDCISEIYKQNLDKKYYEENSLMRKYRYEIKKILKTLKNIDFKNINNTEYEKYLEFLKDQNISYVSDHDPVYTESQISDVIPMSTFSDMSIIKKIGEKNIKREIQNEEENYNFHISKNFTDIMTKDFYTFIPNENVKKEITLKLTITTKENNELEQNIEDNKIEQSQEEEEFNSNSNLSNTDSEEDPNIKCSLVLNPVHYNYLPTDKLYQVKIKPSLQYDLNDELIYNKKLTPMSNSHLLYLNFFYKKTLYHKFFKSNLYHNKISLQSQNYQCYICLKRFHLFLNKIPLEPIYYCSYFMHFICKNCISNEYSIIPYFILANWSFDKYPISQKAKIILEKWYDKPIIYFKKEEHLIKSNQILNQIVLIKNTINYIFDKMKCEKKNEFIENTLGEYKYLALKEIIFSIRDLVEINNNSFLQKIINFYNAFVKHVSGDCPQCFIEGQTCKCGSDEKVFLYDYKNVFYCPICDISYHRKCKGILGYMCGHQ